MNYIGKFFSNFKEFYNEINAATLTGAIDVIVVRDPSGRLVSSPFHVRFGKLGVLKAREKIVDIEVNDHPVDIHMKLGENGEAFFVRGINLDDEIEYPDHLATSPIPCYGSYMKNKNFEETEKNIPLQPHKNSIVNNVEKLPDDENSSDQLTDITSNPESQAQNVNSEKVNAKSQLQTKQLETVKELEVQRCDKSPIKPEETTVRYRRKKRRRSLLKKKNRENIELNNASATSLISNDSQSSECGIFVIEDICSANAGSECLVMESVAAEVRKVNTNAVDKSDWRSTNFAPEHHPFSDTDLSPVTSPVASRPGTPVKSDTEYEMERQGAGNNDTSRWSWSWGEFPTPPPDSCTQSESAPTGSKVEGKMSNDKGSVSWPVLYWSDDVSNAEIIDKDIGYLEGDDQNSMLGGVFSFMRRTKKIRHNPESEGIYLDKLISEDIDPEVAALYFPNYRGMEISRNKDEDVESGNGPSLPHSPSSLEIPQPGIQGSDYYYNDKSDLFTMNGCGDIAMSLCGANTLVETEVPTDLFSQSLVTFDDFLQNPNLISNPDLVIRMGGKYYNWSCAAPIIMSLLLYQRPLPQDVTKKILESNMPKKKAIVEQKMEPKTYSWFAWRRSNIDEKAEKKGAKEKSSTENEDTSHLYQSTEFSKSQFNTGVIDGSKTAPEEIGSTVVQFEPIRTPPPMVITTDVPGRCIRSLRLTSEELSSLNLKEGANEVVFSVTTAYQGTSTCKCYLYLWNYDSKIIISDIDGTITKSDVLGHLMPYIGNNWAQGGVAQLFSKIGDNGYHFLYLSARAIGQAHITKEYLRGIKQGNLFLPDGPMLLNPTSLINALHREVIERKPEEFKISCLTDIRKLFPPGINPFYAGYGNKINDVIAYRAVGIPISRIFTINHRGELKHDLTETFQSTYSDLSTLVDQVFPPIQSNLGMNEFSSFVFWRSPLPEITIQKDPLPT